MGGKQRKSIDQVLFFFPGDISAPREIYNVQSKVPGGLPSWFRL